MQKLSIYQKIQQINTTDLNEQRIKEILLTNCPADCKDDTDGDWHLCEIECTFNYPLDQDGYQHLCPTMPEYMDGIDFLRKYNLMP